MHDATRARWWIAALVGAVPTVASATPAGIYVSERAAGSVVRLGVSDDLTGAPRFATGLDGPQGLCVGPGGDIYVAERDAGEIAIITMGGDMAGVVPWAYGSLEPVGLACNGSRVLVVDAGGTVLDATAGGDLDQTAVVFASGLVAPVDLLVRNAVVWVSGDGAVDVSAGGDFTGVPPFATGQLGTVEAFAGLRLAGSVASPRIENWGLGGDVGAADPFATLPGDGVSVDGLLATADGRLLALVEDRIYDASAGGDQTEAAPLVIGLAGGGAGFEGMLEHLCAYNVDCDDHDVCTGTESCAEEVCIAGESLQCDDGDACTADACDPIAGCTAVAIEGCCTADADCETDELCDVAQHECVPLVVPGDDSGDDGDATDDGDDPDPSAGETAPSTSAPTTDAGADDGATGDTTGDGPGADGGVERAGCACTTAPATPPWFAIALVWITARRRRR